MQVGSRCGFRRSMSRGCIHSSGEAFGASAKVDFNFKIQGVKVMRKTQVSSRLRYESLANNGLVTKHGRILFFVVLALLVSCLPAYSQTDTGAIVGTVSDNSAASLPNATVTLTNLGTNAKTVVKTDGQGNYVATPLKIGNYSVQVQAVGFKEVTRTGIVLDVQDRLRVNFTMQVGSVVEQVTVTGTQPLLQTESSALGDVIESKQIVDLPLNGRDYTQLAALTTGVVKVTESGNGLTGGAQSSANGNAGGSFSVNGTRGLLNNFLLDGIDNNSNDNGGNVLKTNVDAIAEFKVQTSNYSAEFGRSGGA